MKKFLSVILVLSLLFSGIIVSTSAAENELTLGSEIRCTYTGEPLVYSFTPEEDVVAMLYTKDASEGADTNVIVYRNDLDEPLGTADDNDSSLNFCYSDVFEAGYTYTFEINEFYGWECEFTLVFEESPVESIEVSGIPVITCDFSGNYNYDYNGIEITINFRDSQRAPEVIVSDGTTYFEIDGYELFIVYEVLEDENLYLLVSYRGFEEYFEVETDKKTVTGFEILTPPNCPVLYHNIDCVETLYYDEESYEFKTINFYNVYYFGMSVRITYEDESFADVTYDDDPEFFANLKNDLFLQATDPWDLGKHTVTLFLDEFSDTFEVEVVENPYYKAEITRLPYVTESLALGNGSFQYDEELNEYFHYDVSLEGLEVTLYNVNGTTTVINDPYTILTRFRAVTDQETSHWNGGGGNGISDQFDVWVFYGNMFIDSYYFTVWAKAVHEIEIVTPANAAFYYSDNSQWEFDPTGMEIAITANDGINNTTQIVPYQVAELFGVTLDVQYDEENDNYFYYAYSTLETSAPIYFTIVTDTVIDVSITNPPASLTYVNGYGLDVYNMDLSGLEVTVTTADNKKHVWSWNDSDKSGYDAFLNGVISVSATSEYVTVHYRGLEDTCYADDYKDISEYSKGVINKNTTLGIDLNRPEIQVYTFTPWINGEYNLTVEGKPLVLLGVFNEYSELINAVLYEEQLVTNAEKETYTMECQKGETYYILVECLPLLGEFENGNIDFTVEFPIMIGDVNGDGIITTKDILMLRKYLGGLETLTKEEMIAADCDGNGILSTKDVLCIRKYMASIITELPYTS